MHRARGELDRALASYEEGLQLCRRLLAHDPERAEWHDDLAVALGKKAAVAEASGDLPGALALLREALAELEPLAARPSAPVRWRDDAALLPQGHRPPRSRPRARLPLTRRPHPPRSRSTSARSRATSASACSAFAFASSASVSQSRCPSTSSARRRRRPPSVTTSHAPSASDRVGPAPAYTRRNRPPSSRRQTWSTKGPPRTEGPASSGFEDPQLPRAAGRVLLGALDVVLLRRLLADDLDGDARRDVAGLPRAEALDVVALRRRGLDDVHVRIDADLGRACVPAQREVAPDPCVAPRFAGPRPSGAGPGGG